MTRVQSMRQGDEKIELSFHLATFHFPAHCRSRGLWGLGCKSHCLRLDQRGVASYHSSPVELGMFWGKWPCFLTGLGMAVGISTNRSWRPVARVLLGLKQTVRSSSSLPPQPLLLVSMAWWHSLPAQPAPPPEHTGVWKHAISLKLAELILHCG